MDHPTATHAPAPDAAALRLVVMGFTAMERSLLEGTVRLWQRRTPRMALLPADRLGDADVVMVDARDAAAMAWARAQRALANKTVIWVDGVQARRGHMVTARPVQWPVLPVLLAKALDSGRAAGNADAGAPTAHPPPAARSAATGSSATTVPRAAPPVLVVDDSSFVRAHTRSMLEKQGHAVLEAGGGDAALAQLAAVRVVCVLMDVLMPGIDGYETCKRIKSQTRALGHVPVVMLTSRSSPFDRIRGKMAGCDGYLVKPVDAADLREAMQRVLAGAMTAAPGEAAALRPALST